MRHLTVANEKNVKSGTVGKKVTNNNTKQTFYIDNIEVPQFESPEEVNQTFTPDQITTILNDLLSDRAANVACVPLRIASKEAMEKVEGKEAEYKGASKLIEDGRKAARDFDPKSLLGRGEGVTAKARKVDLATEFMASEEYQALKEAGDMATIAAKLTSFLLTK